MHASDANCIQMLNLEEKTEDGTRTTNGRSILADRDLGQGGIDQVLQAVHTVEPAANE